MKCVIYARYSSSKQTEQSIEGQLRVCHEYAERNNIEVVREYTDRALTGRKDKRPDFRRMIVDSENGGWEMILVYTLDRFSRNVFDDVVHKRQLKEYGVRVVSATEHIPDGASGALSEGMLVLYNQYFSEELAIKTRRGLRENAFKCRITGQLPFGYKKGPDKEFLVDEHEAEAVRVIYQRYAAGDKCKDIVSWLNSNGYRTRTGKEFQDTGLGSILRNKKYIGEYKYDDIEIDGGIPAIISVDLWEAARKRMEANKRAPAAAKAKTDYLLSGKVFCGDCRETAVGESGKSRNGRMYHYYKCSGQKKKSGCTMKPVPKDVLENAVIQHTFKFALSGEMIEKISLDICNEIQRKASDKTRVDSIKKAISETDVGINNILNAIQAGIITDSTKARLQELEQKKKELISALESEKSPMMDFTVNDIQEFLKEVASVDYRDPKALKTILDTFIYRVYLYDDYCIILYNITGTDPQTVPYNGISEALEKCSDLDSQGEPRIEAL